MSTAYLARWSGPVDEASDPYNQFSGTSPSHLRLQKHVQDVYWLPPRGGPSDNHNIKWALTNYGGVFAVMSWHSENYDATYHTYYYDGRAKIGDGHVITIVGWNDRFDKNLFGGSSGVPPGDGAFIVKNSWGASWGEHGYFYVSYYDSQFGRSLAVFTAEPTTNYNHVYQYDRLGMVNHVGFKSDTAWFANVFTAKANEQLSAVSFYTTRLNSRYNIYVYKDPSVGPMSSERYGETMGAIPAPGYHTVKLSTVVPLTDGHKFSVVVKLTTPGRNFPIPVEERQKGYSSAATARAGRGYASSDGTSWGDITQLDDDTNVCLKAFTTTGGMTSTPAQFTASATPTTVAVYKPFTFSDAFTTGGSGVLRRTRHAPKERQQHLVCCRYECCGCLRWIAL